MRKTKKGQRLNLEPHLDAGESAFFERELTHIRAQTYDVKYPDTKFRTLLPIDHSVDPGAEAIVYQQFDEVAQAKILASYADDLTGVEIKGREFSSTIKGLGNKFSYSIQEVRAAAMAKRSLTPKKASAARAAHERKMERIAAVGDTATGLLGLLNQANTLTYEVENGEGGTADWDDKTPDEILRDLFGIVLYMVEQTRGVEKPDTLLLPVHALGKIRTTRLNDISETTILEEFLARNGYVRNVEDWDWLSEAGADGSDRMVLYRRDPSKLQFVIPQEFEQFPPQARGLSFDVPCHSRTGGVTCEYPMSICYGDGIRAARG